MNDKICTTRPVEAVTTTPAARKPRVDVFENDAEVRILADMPGTDESSLELTLEDGLLTLRGTPVLETPEGMETRWREFQLGPYERRFVLRDDVSRDGIHASVKDGVVEVILPKHVEEKKSIPITVR